MMVLFRYEINFSVISSSPILLTSILCAPIEIVLSVYSSGNQRILRFFFKYSLLIILKDSIVHVLNQNSIVYPEVSPSLTSQNFPSKIPFRKRFLMFSSQARSLFFNSEKHVPSNTIQNKPRTAKSAPPARLKIPIASEIQKYGNFQLSENFLISKAYNKNRRDIGAFPKLLASSLETYSSTHMEESQKFFGMLLRKIFVKKSSEKF